MLAVDSHLVRIQLASSVSWVLSKSVFTPASSQSLDHVYLVL